MTSPPPLLSGRPCHSLRDLVISVHECRQAYLFDCDRSQGSDGGDVLFWWHKPCLLNTQPICLVTVTQRTISKWWSVFLSSSESLHLYTSSTKSLHDRQFLNFSGHIFADTLTNVSVSLSHLCHAFFSTLCLLPDSSQTMPNGLR